MKWTFAENGWNQHDFRYAYSPLAVPGSVFTRNKDCVQNLPSDAPEKFQYISLLTEKTFSDGVRIETHCSFEDGGAPLIVLCGDMHRAGKDWQFGVHHEIVAYKNGVNVWRLDKDGDTLRPKNLSRTQFEVDAEKIHCLCVQVKNKTLSISLDGTCIEVSDENLPDTFRCGITACEGICRFYDLAVTE